MKFKVGTTIKANFADDLFLITEEVHFDDPECQAAICSTQRNFTMYADKNKPSYPWKISERSRVVDPPYTLVSECPLTTLEKIIYGVKE